MCSACDADPANARTHAVFSPPVKKPTKPIAWRIPADENGRPAPQLVRFWTIPHFYPPRPRAGENADLARFALAVVAGLYGMWDLSWLTLALALLWLLLGGRTAALSAFVLVALVVRSLLEDEGWWKERKKRQWRRLE